MLLTSGATALYVSMQHLLPMRSCSRFTRRTHMNNAKVRTQPGIHSWRPPIRKLPAGGYLMKQAQMCLLSSITFRCMRLICRFSRPMNTSVFAVFCVMASCTKITISSNSMSVESIYIWKVEVCPAYFSAPLLLQAVSCFANCSYGTYASRTTLSSDLLIR